MNLLDQYEKEWNEVDPCDSRYVDDHRTGVCPNERRFEDRFREHDEMDEELNFD